MVVRPHGINKVSTNVARVLPHMIRATIHDRKSSRSQLCIQTSGGLQLAECCSLLRQIECGYLPRDGQRIAADCGTERGTWTRAKQPQQLQAAAMGILHESGLSLLHLPREFLCPCEGFECRYKVTVHTTAYHLLAQLEQLFP